MSSALFGEERLAALAHRIREPLYLVARRSDGLRGLATEAELAGTEPDCAVIGTVPALYPEWLGDRSFGEAHGVRFPYVAGEMAGGIAGTRLVTAMAQAEMLAFLGAAGVGFPALERALHDLAAALGGRSNWGVNLIHTPSEPAREEQVADLLIRYRVPRISVSAFAEPTPAVVRCAATGLRADHAGRVVRRTAVFAKVSRPEVAEPFMAPAPEQLLRLLLERGELTPEEVRLAGRVPVASDVTVEADSGGHTDNRPLIALLPSFLALREDARRKFGYAEPVRVGAAGGLGDPASVAAAFALGAGYVLTGSVNQMAVEADTSDEAKELIAGADLADVAMAPAADMFELGMNVQVLRRGTLFAPRAGRLREVYRRHGCLEEIPEEERTALERDVFQAPLDEIWTSTQEYWRHRDPAQLARAAVDPKHRMALVLRWYLSHASRWAVSGQAQRRADFQVWCGPAAGAFNRWTAGSFLAEPGSRTVVQIARNLLEGAAVVTRAHQLRTFGVPLPPQAFAFRPRPLH